VFGTLRSSVVLLGQVGNPPPEKPDHDIWFEEEALITNNEGGVRDNVSSYDGKVFDIDTADDIKLPKEGFFVTFEFQVKKIGVYEIHAAASIPNSIWTSDWWWGIDDEQEEPMPQEVDSDVFSNWNLIAWMTLGERELLSGKHKMTFWVKDEEERRKKADCCTDFVMFVDAVALKWIREALTVKRQGKLATTWSTIKSH